MPIPDEVWTQVRDAIDAEFHDVAFRVVDGEAQYRAAQVAARAAVVQELRQFSRDLAEAAVQEPHKSRPGIELAYREVAALLWSRADGLEGR